MSDMWGLLGPETLPSLRRTRGLGIAASVRRFNDLAVPGLGGVWFGKQIFLALLGVAVAEHVRSEGGSNLQDMSNIKVANAVEALACWLAYQSNGWTPDPRLRGITKLKDRDALTFRQVVRPGFYVTQPMRMATVQTLPALGLVETDSIRFNHFHCSDKGWDFLKLATAPFRPYKKDVQACLQDWIQGNTALKGNSPPLVASLSPLSPLAEGARQMLRRQFLPDGKGADAERRSQVLAWVEMLHTEREWSWDYKPAQLSSEHWHDLQAGARFFALRDAAITVLDELESHMGTMASPSLDLSDLSDLTKDLPCDLKPLRQAAQQYLDMGHVDGDARAFARECCGDDSVRSLVRRDGQVLQLRGERIVPGPAFRGSPQRLGNDTDEEDGPQPAAVPLPPHISFRVRNLWLLHHDMAGDLGVFLPSGQEEDKA